MAARPFSTLGASRLLWPILIHGGSAATPVWSAPTSTTFDCFSVDGNWNHCNTVFEAMDCYFQYCPCQEAHPSLTDNELIRRTRKRVQDQNHAELMRH